MKIILPVKVTNEVIFGEVLSQFRNYYKHERKEGIEISFQGVESIGTLSIPNLLVLLDILKRLEHEIYIELEYNPRLLAFLYHINFFYYIDMLGLARYDRDYIGGFGQYIDKTYRKEHCLHIYKPNLNYYKYNSNDREIVRTSLYQQLVTDIIPNDYAEVLSDRGMLNSIEIRECIEILSEAIANSILYSRSYTYAFLQTDRFKTSIGVSDSGIGFQKSLALREYDTTCFKYKGLNDSYNDFLAIMKALKYSEEKKRKNLWRLKKVITSKGGTLRIHNRTTQIIFTGNKCGRCEKECVEECFECMLDSNQNSIYPNLRIFEAGLSGVHIEIQI